MKPHLLTLLSLSLALALGGTSVAFAADNPGASDQPQSASEIITFQRELRERLDKPYGEYSRFSETDLARMKRAQDNVFRILHGVSSIDQLSPDQKTDMSNSLDQIKATLLANEGNRQICHRERKTGSNLIALRCETVAEREAHARESNEEMRRLAPSMQSVNGG
jgi:hypothetical protein